ncbi:MAG: class I SAM-dependent methyltransferase [Phycisphaeraceae bacterium]|nr:class I SAM-dependent methyltransferase [Phycisphaeraceae bacterium]
MHRFYDELADLWPLLSPVEDYAAEAGSILNLLYELRYLGNGARPRLLELGAGGGHTLAHLTEFVDATAVDISPAMLEQCGKLNPEVECIEADMCSVTLDREFDVVLCHDAVDYLTDTGQVRRMIRTAWDHLRPGGLFICAPTYTTEEPIDGQVETDQNRDGHRCVTFMSYLYDPDVNDGRFRMVLVVITDEAGQVKVFHEEHELGLFSPKTWLTLLFKQGFQPQRITLKASPPRDLERCEADQDAVPYPVFVGMKPSAAM